MSVVVLNNNPFFFSLSITLYIPSQLSNKPSIHQKNVYVVFNFLVLGAQNSRESGIGNVIFIQSECLLLPFDLWA